MNSNGNVFAIGEMSRRTGVNVETVRYYEKIGLMPKPNRSEGGNRLYNDEQLQRLFFIKRCRGIGFSQSEIRALLAMVDHEDVTCAEVHSITTAHVADIRQKIKDLRKLERVLTHMADECSRGDVPECPIIEALFDPETQSGV
ncbi:MerR family transcriptional regulator [Granulosicoccus sp. 3-233]|uniref:MerR family transcriptional regulator n=1 Tax=Granulosicoccus sp. 3-233 TaxID=3417969 RepID=UPI003D337F74